jgi:carbohydrate kinase (thermoresistant glucokinase family)
MNRMPRIVVMGVSGSGKSTIGALLARELDLPFLDGDDLHPAANRQKMMAGTPLDDADRAPWLALVGRAIGEADGGIVVACSALKRAYRDALRAEAPDVRFVHVTASRDELAARIEARSGHFMPVSLLDSQLAALEPLADDEAGTTVSSNLSASDIAKVAASV